MRIVCDNCGAKYQISDEKVRNKVFKIKCKKCSHVIIVRAKQAEEPTEEPAEELAAQDDPTRIATISPNHEPKKSADAIWYVVINRAQVGPLTQEEIKAHIEEERVDGDTFSWAEGMADWLRLSSVPELKELFPASAAVEASKLEKPAPAAREPEAVAIVASASPKASLAGFEGEINPFEAEDEDVIASDNAGEEDLFGGISDPRVNAQSLRDQRHENSVLFSLDSLAMEAEQAPQPSHSGVTEGSGLLDISIMAPESGRGEPDAFGGGDAFAPMSASPVGVGMQGLVIRPRRSLGKTIGLISVALVGISGLAFGSYAFFNQEEKPIPKVEETQIENAQLPAKVAINAGEPLKPVLPVEPAAVVNSEKLPSPEIESPKKPEQPVESPRVAAVSEEPKAPTSKKRTRRRKKSRTRPKPPKSSREDQPSAHRSAPAPTRSAPRSTPKSAPPDEVDDLLGALDGKPSSRSNSKPPPSSDPMLPEKLSRQQILRVAKRGATSIRGCREGGGGTVTIRMKIAKSGNVQSAKAKGEFAGTRVGSCVEAKVRAFKFPRFGGAPMSFNMPFAL